MPIGKSDIMIVDDNPALLYALSEIFKNHGYSVRVASDGFSALHGLRERVPDLLLSDLNMPGMSGFELLSVVRRRFPMIAVIAMSGAYGGIAVPSGIAADAFYAKGSSSIARLFEILWAIEDRELLWSMRDSNAPIWIPGCPIHIDDASTTVVACPECLRPFSHSLRRTAISHETSSCPHCSCSMKLAVVRQSQEMDITAGPLAPKGNRIGGPAFVGHIDASSRMECSPQ